MTTKFQSIIAIAAIAFATNSSLAQMNDSESVLQTSEHAEIQASMQDCADSVLEKASCYPHELRQKGIGGRVLVRVELDEAGKMVRTRVLSATHPQFATSALRSVSKMDFTASANSKSQALLIPFSFEVTDSARL